MAWPRPGSTGEELGSMIYREPQSSTQSANTSLNRVVTACRGLRNALGKAGPSTPRSDTVVWTPALPLLVAEMWVNRVTSPSLLFQNEGGNGIPCVTLGRESYLSSGEEGVQSMSRVVKFWGAREAHCTQWLENANLDFFLEALSQTRM